LNANIFVRQEKVNKLSARFEKKNLLKAFSGLECLLPLYPHAYLPLKLMRSQLFTWNSSTFLVNRFILLTPSPLYFIWGKKTPYHPKTFNISPIWLKLQVFVEIWLMSAFFGKIYFLYLG